MLGLHNLRRVIKQTSFGSAVDWEPLKTPFSPTLILKASSYKPARLWDVTPSDVSLAHQIDRPDDEHVDSPEGTFRYTEVTLPKGTWLDTLMGNRRGQVCFDGDIVIPRINEMNHRHFDQSPWMSYTPMEVFSQRAGLRKAKGHTVIAGLGLGWLLSQVMKKRSVKKVTLVEISQELVDWILPRLNLDESKLEVRVGDARRIVPRLTADVALTDIDPGYGSNTFPRCPKIGDVWTWGSGNIYGGY